MKTFEILRRKNGRFFIRMLDAGNAHDCDFNFDIHESKTMLQSYLSKIPARELSKIGRKNLINSLSEAVPTDKELVIYI
jgi:hypothetical protein